MVRSSLGNAHQRNHCPRAFLTSWSLGFRVVHTHTQTWRDTRACSQLRATPYVAAATSFSLLLQIQTIMLRSCAVGSRTSEVARRLLRPLGESRLGFIATCTSSQPQLRSSVKNHLLHDVKLCSFVTKSSGRTCRGSRHWLMMKSAIQTCKVGRHCPNSGLLPPVEKTPIR